MDCFFLYFSLVPGIFERIQEKYVQSFKGLVARLIKFKVSFSIKFLKFILFILYLIFKHKYVYVCIYVARLI